MKSNVRPLTARTSQALSRGANRTGPGPIYMLEVISEVTLGESWEAGAPGRTEKERWRPGPYSATQYGALTGQCASVPQFLLSA